MFGFDEILDLFSAAASAYGTYQEGQEAKAQAEGAADAAQTNAALDAERAADAKALGVQQADDADRRKRVLLGKQKAAMGASGVVAGAGTFADLLADTEADSEADQATIMHNALSEAWGYTKRSESESKQAKQYKRAARAAGLVGTIKGIGSLIAGTYQTGVKNGWEIFK